MLHTGQVLFITADQTTLLWNPNNTTADTFALADTTPVPARRGDVVCFNIYTIHGSYINQTDRVRRIPGFVVMSGIFPAGRALEA